jgi:nicotinamide-nucleotide amidase
LSRREKVYTEGEILEAVEKIHDLFKSRGLTLSIAESCTGGFIAHLITTLPGASKFFYGGVITYFTECKVRVLGVRRETINRYGVVSAETAMEMAERVREIMSTDFGVSTTGNLGPETLEGKEVGLVYFGLSSKDKTTHEMKVFSGSRDENKKEAAMYALKLIIDFVNK